MKALASSQVLFYACFFEGAANVHAESMLITTGGQSPAINQGTKGSVIINYEAERIGKKIAIRDAYLIPAPGFDKNTCAALKKCFDFFESAFLYVEIQSVWPEPVLLTAARLKQVGFKYLPSAPVSEGQYILGNQITRIDRPRDFLFQPGETKLIKIGQGVRLKGVMEFFSSDLLKEDFGCDTRPCYLHNTLLVKQLNGFIEKKYGAHTKLDIVIFEKDYKPILVTSFRLIDGRDMFVSGDVRRSNYRLQHDRFIAEVLYTLRDKGMPFRGSLAE